MEGGGVEPDKCSRSKCSSLELACSSRAISLSSCFIRFSCSIFLFSYSISLLSYSISLFLHLIFLFLCSIFLRSNSISRISYSTTGCQLSLDNQRRQGGSEDRNADLLIELEGWAPKEVDMVITREKCDQGEQKAGNERDRAL